MLMNYARAIEAYGNDYGIKKAIEEKKLFRIDDGVYSTKLIVSEEDGEVNISNIKVTKRDGKGSKIKK